MERSADILHAPETIEKMGNGTLPVDIVTYGLQPNDCIRLFDSIDKSRFIINNPQPIHGPDGFYWSATAKLAQLGAPLKPRDPIISAPKPFKPSRYPIFTDILAEHEDVFAAIDSKYVGINRIRFVFEKGYAAVPVALASALAQGWLCKDSRKSDDYCRVLIEISQVLRDAPASAFRDVDAIINEICGTYMLGSTCSILTFTDLLDVERKRRRHQIHNWGFVKIGPVLTRWVID